MNVFILCTGRCGSKTFSKACYEITNYSTGFETRTMLIGNKRTEYPENHIEIDNRLSWFLGRLDREYGDAAAYVHLKRFVDDVAKSYARRYRTGIMRAYRGKGMLLGVDESIDRLEIVKDYVDTVSSNIELFLKDKTKKMEFHIERAKEDFPVFCELIGADVDLNKAMEHFNKRYNESKGSKHNNTGKK